MTAKRIYVIRHGQTEWNAIGRWQGTLHVTLNETGREQAAQLAAYYQNTPISAVYSSDLARAFETAQALAAARGLEAIPDERLREVHLGALQGLTRDEIIAQYRQDWDEMHVNYFEWLPPGGGETRRQVQTRMFEALNDIAARHPGEEIALVSHGLAIRVMLMRVFEHDFEAMRRVDIHNTSVTVLESNGSGWTAERLADTRHLTPIEVDAEHDKGEAQE